jgi:hypothetical protein
MTRPFNYQYYTLAYKILNWADRQVIFPNDDPQSREYALKTKNEALQECREKRLTLLPLAKTKTTGKNKGWITVVVQMPDGTEYGWLYSPDKGNQIYELLCQEITRWERE